MEKFPKPKKTEGAERFSSRLEITKTPKGEILELVEGDKKVDCQSFVPKGVKFVLDNWLNFGYDPENKIITVDESKLGSLKGRLGLLHEMGHAIDFDKNKEDSAAWMAHKELYEKINAIKLATLLSKNYSQAPTSEARLTYFQKTFAEGVKMLHVPEPQIREFVAMVAQEERAACAEALKLYRRIKTETGIDMLDQASFRAIAQNFNDLLKNYDQVIGQLLPDQQTKLFLVKKFGNV